MCVPLAAKLAFTATCLLAFLFLAPRALGQVELDMEGAEARAEGWELQFSDDFSRVELGENWRIVGGNWTLKNGILEADGPGHLV